MIRFIRFIFILLTTITFSFCSSKEEKKSTSNELHIVTTTGMVTDLVENIVGDSAKVQGLMGAGVDPHLYKATQGDLKKLQKGDVIIYNGLHLEGKMNEIFEKLSERKPTFAIADFVSKENLLEDKSFSENYDPHIWFDVALWSQAIDGLTQQLSKLKPDSKQYFETNAIIYKSKLKELNSWVKVNISKIPKEQRVLITAHDAFGYFGRAYDIEVKGLQGISTLSEFGLKDRLDLGKFIIKRNIKAIFVETSVSDKNSNSIIEDCKNKGHNLTIGGTLFSDAMGESGTEEGTYIGMVKSNVQDITESLK